VFFLKKEQKSVSLKKNKKQGKKTGELLFKKNLVFINPDYLSIFFGIFP